MSVPSVKLNNGLEIPAVGFGTWQSADTAAGVEYAIKEAGYRHIDTAWAYDNEKDVGEGIRRSGVPRSEIFLTSKIWPVHMHEVEKALDVTLANLGTDYLDLYLLHWPVHLNPNGNHFKFPTRPDGSRDIVTDWKIKDTWKQMEDVLKKGKVKAIGVSNVSQRVLENDILPYAEIVPAADQIELHVYNPQHKLVEFLKSKGITPQAYSPLGSTGSPLLQDETAAAIAKKHGLSVSDVLLGYLVAKGIVVLAKSNTPARIKSNLDGTVSAAQKLTKEDIETLDGVAAAGKQKRFITPPWGVDFGFDNWPQ